MNETLQVLQQHRTFRHFVAGEVLPEAQVQAMLDAARQAPSWMNGQRPLRNPTQTSNQSRQIFFFGAFCLFLPKHRSKIPLSAC